MSVLACYSIQFGSDGSGISKRVNVLIYHEIFQSNMSFLGYFVLNISNRSQVLLILKCIKQQQTRKTACLNY